MRPKSLADFGDFGDFVISLGQKQILENIWWKNVHQNRTWPIIFLQIIHDLISDYFFQKYHWSNRQLYER